MNPAAPGSLVALRQAAAAHQRADEERLAAALEREAAKVRELEEDREAAEELTDVEQELEQLRSEYATRREHHSAALLAGCRESITRVPRLAAVMTAEQALADPERVLAWLLSAAGTAHPTAPAAGLIPPTPPTPAEAAEQAEEGSCEGAAAPSRCPGLMEEARPPAREAASSDAPPPKRTRYTEKCWGDVVSGGALGCEALPPQASRAAFSEKFCGRCRQRGVFVPASRVRMPIGAGSGEIANSHGPGFWNEPSPASRWPAHRVVNQTSDCSGPRLVILKDESPVPLPGLAEAAALSASDGWVAFTVGRTLRRNLALPSAVAIPLSPAPPPERDTPEARTASAEGRVEGFAAAAQAGEASGSALEAGLEPFLAEISFALGPLAEAGTPPPLGPDEMTWHFGGGSTFDELLLSGSATPPLLQTRPNPEASVPPPSMPPSPPATAGFFRHVDVRATLFSQHALGAAVACSCAVHALASYRSDASNQGDSVVEVNIWGLMLTVVLAYALARAYGSYRRAALTITYGTTVASIFTLLFDALRPVEGTTAALGLAAFADAPVSAVGCQFAYGLLLGVQPLNTSVRSKNLCATIGIWATNLASMLLRTGDAAFLSVLLARTALPLSAGFSAGVGYTRWKRAAAAADPEARSLLEPPSPPPAPPGPSGGPSSDPRPDVEQAAPRHRITQEERVMISRQEAALRATQIDPAGFLSRSVTKLLECLTMEDSEKDRTHTKETS
ncbi:hypothetical protein EMIHUDRAFT_101887 [Emiliania huxleyi CCMP1516]|uniref:Uncharacterized protein n=2 Tax=Emiliania huxleyi TaxID=2903 RepID=A0A0D3JAM9_EMIH1|nr:hypothetical protein EMIHUDRAFT_101887 [Emiliania huxleyi CCMP1516]EOD20564.1 hypothetical protein EMIHUDRAFT_101887 [Emiliania huxleyi CCMP1516]|eukprot:XP_005772993.1 hypothetical protein EMIHUDRAFT_101887 [Emiliania huxleyi CCMP1516]